MAIGSYLFPPIGGWGNPAWPWTPNDGIRSITLDGHIGTEMMFSAFVSTILKGLLFRASAPAGTLERPHWIVRGKNESSKMLIYPAATVARSSVPQDMPANLWVPDVLQQTLNFARGLFSTADPRQVAQPGSGIIELDDTDGQLDYLFDFPWDTVPITMYRGYETEMFKTWSVIGRFSGASIIASWDKKQIRLRDVGWNLTVPLHPNYYAGTGGREGGDNLTGVWKPYAIGYSFNVEPVLIDAQNQVYQWSFTPSQAVTALRHGGVVIAFHQDFPTYEALIAAVLTVPDGKYATCLAESMVLVSLDIEKSIRVDVQGDNSVQFGHGRPLSRGEIVRRIATCYGDSVLDDSDQIDNETFTKLQQDHSAPIGFYWSSLVNKDAAMTEVMSGILGWWYVRLLGILAVGYAREPRQSDAVAQIAWQQYNMSLIDMIDFATPRTATHIGWKRNYGQEARSQLAGSVDETTGAILSQDTSWAITTDDSILDIYPTSETVKIQGNYAFEADAIEESTRQQQLMGVPRRRWRMSLDIDVFAPIMDQIIHLTDVNRLTLGASKYVLCVNVDTVGFGPVTLDFWG